MRGSFVVIACVGVLVANAASGCGSDDEGGAASSNGGPDGSTDGAGGGDGGSPNDSGGDRIGPVDDGGLTPKSMRVFGAYHRSCAIAPNGHAKCWGQNSYGDLGIGDTDNHGDGPNEMGAMLPLREVGSGRTVSDVAGGYAHTCVVRDDGAVKCHGFALYGALGYGDTNDRGGMLAHVGDGTPNVALGSGRTARAITASLHFTCAILDDGRVKCWGINDSGQLGIGNMDTRGTQAGQMGDALPAVDLGVGRTAKAITAGSNHVCAILDDGRVKCWGNNGEGQLGISGGGRGDGLGAMGDQLPAVDLGVGRTARAISSRERTTCALLDDATVKCWGSNAYGQLGRGDDSIHGSNEGHATIALGTGRTAKAIAVGAYHVCAIVDDDRVKCWGGSPSGELGAGNTDSRGDDPNEMGDAVPYVDLGAVQTAKSIGAGLQHTCVVLTDDTVKCWGGNDSGELGLGVNAAGARGDGQNEMGTMLPAVDIGTL